MDPSPTANGGTATTPLQPPTSQPCWRRAVRPAPGTGRPCASCSTRGSGLPRFSPSSSTSVAAPARRTAGLSDRTSGKHRPSVNGISVSVACTGLPMRSWPSVPPRAGGVRARSQGTSNGWLASAGVMPQHAMRTARRTSSNDHRGPKLAPGEGGVPGVTRGQGGGQTDHGGRRPTLE